MTKNLPPFLVPHSFCSLASPPLSSCFDLTAGRAPPQSCALGKLARSYLAERNILYYAIRNRFMDHLTSMLVAFACKFISRHHRADADVTLEESDFIDIELTHSTALLRMAF